jgi:chromate transporter
MRHTSTAVQLPPTTVQQPEPLGPERPRDLSDLFWSLNGLSLQGFGGVLAVVQRVLVEQRRWYTPAQFVEAWAVAQVMPGPNIINLCADLGARYFGIRGVLVSIAGLLLVPFCIAIALSASYTTFADVAWVTGAVRGMAAVSAGIIMSAGLRLSPTLQHHVLGTVWALGFAITGFVMVGLLRWNLSAVLLGLGFIACALTWRVLTRRSGSVLSQNSANMPEAAEAKKSHD